MHTVQAGDSLYKISRQYQTTVTDLIMGNPGVNPYNLKIGMRLAVCPGAEYEGEMQTPSAPLQMPGQSMMPGIMPQMPEQGMIPMPPITSAPSQSGELTEEMRLAWLSHIYWIRMYLMSAAEGSPDLGAVEERVLQTADEIADIFARVVPLNVARQIRSLLTEHIELTGEIIKAFKAGNTQDYEELIKSWYANINQLADLLGKLNPIFSGRETRSMLLRQLDLMRDEIEQQLNGEYQRSIETFRNIEQNALDMADFFARGLFAR